MNKVRVVARRVVGTVITQNEFGESVKNLYKGCRGGLYYIGTKRRPYSKVYLSQLNENTSKRVYIESGSIYDELERV